MIPMVISEMIMCKKLNKKSLTNLKKKKVNRHVGKIGWCYASVLGLPMGHYVYIRKVKNGKCDVNTFTSLEKIMVILNFIN